VIGYEVTRNDQMTIRWMIAIGNTMNGDILYMYFLKK
jgi:hypothetical protein